ncbi:MAG: DUF4881 domain-containing protein [Syntrophobacteraceae bacterium]
MAKYRKLIIAMLLILPVAFISGCEYGKVDQGRVIKMDKDKGLVTLIRDVKNDQQNPDYSFLPALTYSVPKDPMEMGAEPHAGMRMKLDAKKNEITIYDTATQKFKTIPYTLIEQKEDVAKDDPLVYDVSQKKAKKFPAVDKDKKTITIYSGRQKILTTFSLPAEYFNLPDSTWDAGDEVRIYYKEDGKALRFMNITKTDIFKK